MILNLLAGLVSAAGAVPIFWTFGLPSPQTPIALWLLPALALWLIPAAFFGAVLGLRQGGRPWGRWLAALLNLGCAVVLGGFAVVAGTGLAGLFALFPVLVLGAALAAWNTVSLIRRAV